MTAPDFYPQIVAMRSNFKEARYDFATVAYLPLYSPGPVQTWSCLNLPMNPLVASMMRLSNAEDAKSQIGRIYRKRKASTHLPRTLDTACERIRFHSSATNSANIFVPNSPGSAVALRPCPPIHQAEITMSDFSTLHRKPQKPKNRSVFLFSPVLGLSPARVLNRLSTGRPACRKVTMSTCWRAMPVTRR